MSCLRSQWLIWTLTLASMRCLRSSSERLLISWYRHSVLMMMSQFFINFWWLRVSLRRRFCGLIGSVLVWYGSRSIWFKWRVWTLFYWRHYFLYIFLILDRTFATYFILKSDFPLNLRPFSYFLCLILLLSRHESSNGCISFGLS